MKFLAWSEDKWLSKEGNVLPYDKVEHFLYAFFGVIVQFFLVSPYILNNPSPAGLFISANLFSISMFIRTLGILRELYDSVVPYHFTPRRVQGWSWKDLIANEAGIHAACQVILFIKQWGTIL